MKLIFALLAGWLLTDVLVDVPFADRRNYFTFPVLSNRSKCDWNFVYLMHTVFLSNQRIGSRSKASTFAQCEPRCLDSNVFSRTFPNVLLQISPTTPKFVKFFTVLRCKIITVFTALHTRSSHKDGCSKGIRAARDTLPCTGVFQLQPSRPCGFPFCLPMQSPCDGTKVNCD